MGKEHAEQSLVGGLNTVIGLLEGDSAGRVRAVWLQSNRRDGRFSRLERQARRAGVPVHRLARKELDSMLPEVRHQGAIAEYAGAPPRSESDLGSLLDKGGGSLLLLVLDGVQDPHNLGACLRSAAAAGVDGVIAPRDRAVGMTPTVRKVASGGAEAVPFIQVTNLARTLETLAAAGVYLVGLAGEGDTSLYNMDLHGPLALVLGAEGKGMRRPTREHCDALANIPMSGRVDSLNVSVATGIALFEARRQRMADSVK